MRADITMRGHWPLIGKGDRKVAKKPFYSRKETRNRLHGKMIVDAPAPLTFTVTKKDIANAKTANPMTCAIAQGALHGDDVKSVRIGRFIALVEKKNVVLRYEIQKEDRRKIDAFDFAHYFQPGQYTLITPRSWLSQKKKDEIRERQHQKGYKPKRRVRGRSNEKTTGHVERRLPMRHALRVHGKGVAAPVAPSGEVVVNA